MNNSLLKTLILALMFITSSAAFSQEEDIFNFDDGLDVVDEGFADDGLADDGLDGTNLATDDSATEAEAPTPDDATTPIQSEPFEIQMLRESNPTKPDELLRAASLALDFNRPDLAAEYFTQLRELSLDDESAARLHSGNDGRFWLRLSTDTNLDDASKETAMNIIRAADRYARSSQNINQLIERLTSGSTEDFRSAIRELRRSRESAVNPLVAAMANPDLADDPDLADYKVRIQAALISLGKSALNPLHASLDHSKPGVRAAIIEVIGRIGAKDSSMYLLGPAYGGNANPVEQAAASRALQRILGATPSVSDATTYLCKRVDHFGRGKYRAAAGDDGTFPFWTWNAEQQRAIPYRVTREDAAAIVASRLASDLYAIQPNHANRLADLGYGLARDKRIGGVDMLLPRDPGSAFQQAARAGTPVVEEVLANALRNNQHDVALGAIEVLGEIGNSTLLMSTGQSLRPLTKALQHESARVRFAAASAIVQLDPKQSYRGSSQLVEMLSHFATSKGRSRVLVGHPNAQTAGMIAGLFSQLGMDVDIARTGNDFRKASIESIDYEFFLISDRIDRPIVSRLVQQLRVDPRTGEVPIAVMTIDENLDRVRLNAQEASRTIGVAQPFSREAAADLSSRLLKLNERNTVSPEQRAIYADESLLWLANLGSREYGFYSVASHEDRLIGALFSLERSAQAASALASVGTPSAQYALWRTARQEALPTNNRKAAADAFEQSIRRYHVMLTERQLSERLEAIDDPINRELNRSLNIVLTKNPQ